MRGRWTQLIWYFLSGILLRYFLLFQPFGAFSSKLAAASSSHVKNNSNNNNSTRGNCPPACCCFSCCFSVCAFVSVSSLC